MKITKCCTQAKTAGKRKLSRKTDKIYGSFKQLRYTVTEFKKITKIWEGEKITDSYFPELMNVKKKKKKEMSCITSYQIFKSK